MKAVNYIIMAAVMFLCLDLTLAARPDRRQARQHHRINQGVRSGELTRAEAKDLRQEQRAIQKKKHEMRQDDGKLDSAERRELRQDQNEASKDIYEEKHDDQKR